MAKKLQRSSIIAGYISKAEVKTLAGLYISVDGSKNGTKPLADGSFRLKTKEGDHALNFSVRGGTTLSSRVELRPGLNYFSIAINTATKQITLQPIVKNRAKGEVSFEEPVVLLPLKLQVRQIKKGSSRPQATFEKDVVKPEATPSRSFQPFTQKINIKTDKFTRDEYWIRWYPDDIHDISPVGRITQDEKTHWSTFYKVFTDLKTGRASLECLRSFLQTLDASEWSVLGSLHSDNAADQEKMLKWLNVFYGFRPGTNTIPQVNFCKLYHAHVVPQVNNESLHYREMFGWRDMENPALKTAWIALCREVGPERALQISQDFETTQGWDFDTVYPFYVDVAHKADLDRKVLSDTLRTEIQSAAAFTFTTYKVDVTPDGWTIDDDGGQNLMLRMEDDAIAIYNYAGEEDEPLEIMLDQGMKIPTLPEEVALFTVTGKKIDVVQDNIKINRDKIRLAPTELEGSHWATDFSDAVADGMGVKIVDAPKVKQIDEADWLIIVGVNKTSDSRTVLEDIFRRCHARLDLAIMAQDSPTNNTDDEKTGREELLTMAEEILDVTRMNLDIEDEDTVIAASTDAYKLNKLLRMDLSAFSNIPGSGLTEQREAMAMATIVWESLQPALGLYLNNNGVRSLLRINITAHLPILRKFFIQHVRARGTMPVLRVGNNPYGILPVMSGRKLATTDALPDNNTSNTIVNVVNGLKSIFLGIADQQVVRVDEGSSEAYEQLMEVLRSTAVSQKVDVRKADEGQDNILSLKFGDEAYAMKCNPVKDRVNASSATQTGPNAYPFYPETDYLDAFNTISPLGNFASSTSPLLARIIRYTLDHITGSATEKIIANQLSVSANILKRVPPDKLQTLLMETLDLFAMRLDAWITGIADLQLSNVIEKMPACPPVGVFGWLEQPGKFKTETTAAEFVYCPSDQHATTACVLRAASLTTNPQVEEETFQINLSSRQVRKGEWLLDGIRNGYNSEELLGYQLERMIKDVSKTSSVITPADIYTLREKFPLTLDESKDEDRKNTSRVTIIDGEKFIQGSTEPKYAALMQELVRIKDGASDIAISEVIFHEGNPDRQAAWMDFIEGKVVPPQTEFIKTKRTGIPVNSQLYFVFDGSVTKAADTSKHLRTIADPVFANLCKAFVGDLAETSINVRVTRGADTFVEVIYKGSALSLEAVDLVIGGEKELLQQLRYRVLREWKKATSSFQSLGAFPASEKTEDVLNQTGIRFVNATDEAFSIALEKAAVLRRLFLGQASEKNQNVNPLELPLWSDDTKRELNIPAAVRVLEDRVRQITLVYQSTWTLLIREVAKIIHVTTCKAAIGKVRGLLTTLKTTTDDADKQLLITHIRQTVLRVHAADITSVNAFVNLSPANENNKLLSIGGNSNASIDEMIEGMFKCERLVDLQIVEKVAALTNSDAIASLAIVRNYRLALVDHQQLAAGSISITAMINEVVSDVMAKVAQLLQLNATKKAGVDTLAISLLRWEEISFAFDSTSQTTTGWENVVKGKLTTQLRISADMATTILNDLNSSGKNYQRFVSTQLRRMADPWTFAQAYPTDWDDQRKIAFNISTLQDVTDKETIPVLTPYLLKDVTTAPVTWPISLPPLSSTAKQKLETYQKVRPVAADALQLLKWRTDLGIFEGTEVNDDDSESPASEQSIANHWFIGPTSNQAFHVNNPVILKLVSWNEKIPYTHEKTSVAVHYESPRNECPNAILVAVPPKLDPQRQWNHMDIAEVVAETLELMRIRMVTSEQVRQHPSLGSYLPATLYITDSDFVPVLPKIWQFGNAPYIYKTQDNLSATELQNLQEHFNNNLPNGN